MKLLVKETNILSKESTTCLKGVFTLCVLWHHISQKSMRFYATNLGTIFQMMGYLSVAMFFFISGYGLMKSVMGGGTRYIHKFPRNRILTFYFDVAIFTALYCVSNVIMYGPTDWLLVVKTLTYGGTIISNGWYFQVALILYILFYVSFVASEQPQAALRLCSVSAIGFYALNIIFKQSQTLYKSVLTFPLGMLLASNGKLLAKITQFSSAVIASFVFAFTVDGEYLLRGSLAGVLSKMLSALAFVVCILCFFHTISRTNGIVLFFNPILKWLGCRSLEIYGV